MSAPSNGGPAYPHTPENVLTDNPLNGGMSVRTAIAMHLFSGHNANPDPKVVNASSQQRAMWAITDADTLIGELTKDGGVL